MALHPLPIPPLALSVAPATDKLVIAIMASLMAGALLFGIIQFYRTGRPIALILFVGGGCMMIMEPLVDTVAACWFAANSTIAYVGYGRPIPLWLCLTYFVYFGIGSAVIWSLMARGITRAQVWMVFGGEILADFVLETILLQTSLYTYYGHQPLLIGRFPLWWAFVNALVSLSAAALTFEIVRRVDGWRTIVIVPAMLCASAAANAAAGWPSWFVINSDVGPVWTQIGGLASIAIACTAVSLIAARVARPTTEQSAAAGAWAHAA